VFGCGLGKRLFPPWGVSEKPPNEIQKVSQIKETSWKRGGRFFWVPNVRGPKDQGRQRRPKGEKKSEENKINGLGTGGGKRMVPRTGKLHGKRLL